MSEDLRKTRRHDLSCLVDDECDPTVTERLCDAWRDDDDLRSTWHAYQLVGDVMRSDDLATGAVQGEQFLQRLRARLADEPVVLAPSPASASTAAAAAPRAVSRRRPWLAPAAVAAGFVAVAGVLVATRLAAPGAPAGGGAMLAGAPAGPAGGMQAVSSGDANVVVLRSAEIDQYLSAHRQFGNAPAVMPTSVVRVAVPATPGR